MLYMRGSCPSVVIALGGNALGNTAEEQLELVKNTARHIVDMVGDGTNVVVTHGNGPPSSNATIPTMACRRSSTRTTPLPCWRRRSGPTCWSF